MQTSIFEWLNQLKTESVMCITLYTQTQQQQHNI